MGSLFKKFAGLKSEGSNSCFPVKFVKFLRAPNFKQHLRTTAREPKLLRCIVFIKTMANITSRSKVLSNYLFILISLFPI